MLEGYLFTLGAFPMMTVDVLTEATYRERLQAMFDSVDTSFVDGRGGGSPQVLGVKECGGWTITWTAAMRAADGSTERMAAFFSFVTEDLVSNEWYTEGLWLMPLSHAPGSELEPEPTPGNDPLLDDLACDGPTRPWRS